MLNRMWGGAHHGGNQIETGLIIIGRRCLSWGRTMSSDERNILDNGQRPVFLTDTSDLPTAEHLRQRKFCPDGRGILGGRFYLALNRNN